MSSIDRVDPVIMGHVLAQHHELHAQIVAVRSMLAPPLPEAGHTSAVRAALESLREHLRSHFVQEEAGGFLEESITRMPRLAGAAKGVLAEHPALLADLDHLLETLRTADHSASAWRQSGQEFERFAARLVAHERSENAVLQEGYNEDLGL